MPSSVPTRRETSWSRRSSDRRCTTLRSRSVREPHRRVLGPDLLEVVAEGFVAEKLKWSDHVNMLVRPWFVLPFLPLGLLSSCGGGSSAAKCVAEATVACACPGQQSGVQTCTSSGPFAACVCATPTVDAGFAGGADGAATSSPDAPAVGGSGGSGGVTSTGGVAGGSGMGGATAGVTSGGDGGHLDAAGNGSGGALGSGGARDAGGITSAAGTGGSGGTAGMDGATATGVTLSTGGSLGGSGGSSSLDAGVLAPPSDPGAEPVACDNPTACADFPANAVNDPNSPSAVPADPGSQFSGSASSSGPCVTEPEDSSLFPYNWTRPRIKWSGTTGLVQITVHADIEAHDLVVYTTGDHWIMNKAIWDGLRVHVHESDISVTVRAASGGATTVKFQIASASAAGSIVFWAADPTAINNQEVKSISPTSSFLRGFTVGEEGVADTLKFTDVKQPSRDQSASIRTPTCIGCHSATPDSGFVAFVDNWPWNSLIAGVKPGIVGNQLSNLSVGGLAALQKPWGGVGTFSSAAWQDGRRIMVTTSSEQNELVPWSTDNTQPAKLVWYNLDSPTPSNVQSLGANQQPIAQLAAGNYGIIARNGDSNGVAFPTWSHDGTNIIYSSTAGGNMDGRLQQGATDLYMVPFNAGNGGDAKPVPGASDKSYEEYYAAYAPDDSMVLFDRIPSGGVMYANPAAEIYFAPLGHAPGAGTAIRLAANDPVACSGKTSPGVNNHYPKWAPQAQTNQAGRTYYWIVYSSNRAGLPRQTCQV